MQLEILHESISTGVKLSTLLENANLSYDSLIYQDTPIVESVELRPLETLDTIQELEATIPAVSFFSGAGGLDVGFAYAGFNNMISIEFNEIFCETLRKNSPQKVVIGPPNYSGDISEREE